MRKNIDLSDSLKLKLEALANMNRISLKKYIENVLEEHTKYNTVDVYIDGKLVKSTSSKS